MKTQRQKFEEWIDSLTFEQLHSLEERSAWIAWQAAIESVVVELPANTEFAAWVSGDMIDGYKAAIGDVIDSLDKAGISHK